MVEHSESECSEAEVERSESAIECSEPDCDARASVRLHVPWAEDRPVCAAHGRALVQQEGVVAEPILDDGDGGDDGDDGRA